MEQKLPNISDQIQEFVRKNAQEINSESFTTLEFVIEAGRLTGMRSKRFIKNK